MSKVEELHAYICATLEQAEKCSFTLTREAYDRYVEGCRLVGREPFPTRHFDEYRAAQKKAA
jgi:hypothetical protein